MPGVVENGAATGAGNGANTGSKLSKNAFRRAKKKAQKHKETPSEVAESDSNAATTATPVTTQADSVMTIDDLASDDGTTAIDNLPEEYAHIIRKFQGIDAQEAVNKPEVFYEDDDIQDEEEEQATIKKLSKKAKKEANKLSIAELKALVKTPELVEWTDVSSSDPRLLISIKGQKNVVPVPTHWSLKREYLSSKRGIEKPPFVLPKFIQETGIQEMREAVIEKQEQQTLKQKQRERVQGKMGKLDIDYQKLYEAFFRRQTKPELTLYGEVYYEGKEYETNLKHLRPGELSDELVEALSMQRGAPPPWLINQQRFGPPPSYPALKVPGVNAPIPPGASWGFGPGQYGKPPVDDQQRPFWGGDVYGTVAVDQLVQSSQLGEPVERITWGVMRAEGESDDEESDEEEEEEEDADEVEAGSHDASGTETSMTGASYMHSDFGGTESISGEFTLRKQRKGIETEEPAAPRSAYQVLPEQNIQSKGFFGGERAYDLNATKRDDFGQDNRRKRKAGDVDVSVNLDALARDEQLDKDTLRKQYDSQKNAEAPWNNFDEDLSEMIATESRKRQKKDEERRGRR